MEKIKIVQYGVTHEHAAGKIASLRKLTDIFEIVGVIDDRASSAARFPQEVDMSLYEGLNFITPEEFFRRQDIQAVIIETANSDLVPTALKCLEKNIAMHMDKPGGETIEPFEKLSLECEKRNIPFQMGYMLRGNPAVRFCIDAVKKGLLGDIFEIQADMHHHYGGEEYSQYLRRINGGLMYNLCCHLIDSVVSMMGAPENIVSMIKRTANSPVEAMNNCVAIMEYEFATVTLRSCSKDYGLGRRLRIAGTKGVIEMSPVECFYKPLDLSLSLAEASGDYPQGLHKLTFPLLKDRYEPQFRELAAIINKERPNNQAIYAHDRLVNRVILGCAQLQKYQKQ